jgi:hypothetical protein
MVLFISGKVYFKVKNKNMVLFISGKVYFKVKSIAKDIESSSKFTQNIILILQSKNPTKIQEERNSQ